MLIPVAYAVIRVGNIRPDLRGRLLQCFLDELVTLLLWPDIL